MAPPVTCTRTAESLIRIFPLEQVKSVLLGISYLVIFGFGSVLGMMLVSTLIGVPFAVSAQRLTKVTIGLQAVAGCVGLCFGVGMLLRLAQPLSIKNAGRSLPYYSGQL